MFFLTPKPSRDDSATLVRRRPSLDFSLTGLVYCALMMFMGLAAINTGANLLFGIFGLMIGILLISGIISRKVLRRLHVRRTLPDHGSVGRPLTITYQLQNQKRFWPSLSVTVAELDGAQGFTRQPQCYMLHAAAGMTVTVPAEVIPRRRGLHQLERFQISTSFPFGFIKRAMTARHQDRLLVYPPLGQVDQRLLQLCRAAEHTGAALRPRRGGDDEFYGIKEYRPGDNPRRIYWRRSARGGAPGTALVAREMTQVTPPRLMLVVDSFAPSRSPEQQAAVEKSIAMAASLAAAALETDLSVGLVAWTGGEGGGYVVMEPSRGKRHRTDLLSTLARLPLNTQAHSGEMLAHAARWIKSGTTAVLLTPGATAPSPSQVKMRSLLTLPADSPSASAWFKFDEGINFSLCVPTDQRPTSGPMYDRRWGLDLRSVAILLAALVFLALVTTIIWTLMPRVVPGGVRGVPRLLLPSAPAPD